MPKLRFPEFDTDLMSSDLIDLSNNIASGSIKSNDEGKYDVHGSTGIIGKSDQFSHEGTYLLVARVGANAGTINKVSGKFAVTDNTLIVDVNDQINITFLFNYLENYDLNRHIFGSGQPLITGTILKNLRIVYPHLDEQKKIADFLSSVDQKIQQLRRKKELLEEYKKGVMQKLFSQEIRFKDENGEDFPDWETIKLQEVAEVNPRSGGLPESFIYIDLESVEDGRLLKEEEITLSEAPSRAQRLLEPGDILFQTVRPYQMNNYLFDKEGNYVASSGYAQIKAKQNRYFLFYLLHYQPIVNLVIRWSTGSSFPAISANDLVDLPLPFPSEKEQQKIADVLNLLSTKIHTIESKIEKFQTFKKGLLQQMFV